MIPDLEDRRDRLTRARAFATVVEIVFWLLAFIMGAALVITFVLSLEEHVSGATVGYVFLVNVGMIPALIVTRFCSLAIGLLADTSEAANRAAAATEKTESWIARANAAPPPESVSNPPS